MTGAGALAGVLVGGAADQRLGHALALGVVLVDATCQRCGQRRRPALHGGGEVFCGDCAGVPQTRVCAECGIEDITYDRGRCPACSLHARLEHWRTDGLPEVIARIEPQLVALEHAPNALSVLQWLAKPGGRTLADLTLGRVELSHAALDALDRGKSTDELRATLVQHGVLDARDETLAALERWTTERLAALQPGADATLLRAFAAWKIGRELAARRARHGGVDALAITMPKRWIGTAIELTAWLHARDRTLDELDQPLFDSWLAARPASGRRTIRPLISWLHHRHQHRALRVPTAPDSTRVLALDDHRRLAALRRLLHDEEIEPRLRLAGCLVCLYAQPAARIVRLTTSDLSLTDTAAQIRLGDDPITLPAPLRDPAGAILQHANTTNNRFLFAGQKAGQPMHPTHLARRLRTLGVPVASARPSALAALAHCIPAPVLADLLGFGAQTICNANADLKVDYASYVARRT